MDFAAPAAVSHAAQASFSRAEGKREESPQPTAIVSDATGSREAEKTFSDKAISPASEVSSMEPTPDVPTPAAVRPKRKTQKPVEPEVPPANQADNYNDETPAHTSQVGALNPSARPEVRTEPTLAESSVAALPKRQPQMPLKKNEVKAMERARSEGQAASVPSDVTPVEPERMAPVIFPEGQTEARASPSLDESEIGPPMPADKRKGRPSKVPPQMVPPDVSRPELPDESWTTPVENVQEVPSVVGDAVQPTATSPSTHMPALPPRASSITASESTSNPSVGVPNRSRQTSAQLPEIRGKSVTAQHARLARRVACIICDEVPTHLQKDCPRVKAGLESLQDLLEEREDEEPSDTTEASIQAIKAWIDRLTTIRKKVMGLEGGQVARSVSPNRAAPKLAMAKLQGNHAVQQEMATAADPATNAVNGKTGQARDPTPPLPITTDRTKHSEAIQPVSPANDRSTTPFHPLYLKALSRPRTAGSLSGLSASDAVIETGGSDQGSSGDESEGGDPSVEDDDYSHSKETAYSVESGSDNESASGSDEEDGSDESATTETESLPSDGSDLAKILTKPLSERQKRAARESAASIQHFDLTMPPDDDNSDIVGSDSDDEQDVRKGGSDSSIADFGEAEDESKASEASEIRTLARPPELAAKSNTSSPQSHRSSRSFAAIDDHAGESPAVDEFEGAVALREAIDEEDRPEREAMAGILVEESADKDEAPRSHIISQGLPSPPSSHDNDFFPEIIPTQLASGMDVDHSPSVSKRSTRPNKALLAPPIELDRPTSDRRLRSASRETTGEPSQLFRGYRSPVLDSSPTVAGNASSRPTRTTRTSVERSPLASQSMRTSNTSSPQSAAVRSIKTAKEPSQQSSTSRKASPGATLDIDGGRGSKTPSRVSTPPSSSHQSAHHFLVKPSPVSGEWRCSIISGRPARFISTPSALSSPRGTFAIPNQTLQNDSDPRKSAIYDPALPSPRNASLQRLSIERSTRATASLWRLTSSRCERPFERESPSLFAHP